MYIYISISISISIYIEKLYIYIGIHTHTHTHTYIYIITRSRFLVLSQALASFHARWWNAEKKSPLEWVSSPGRDYGGLMKHALVYIYNIYIWYIT